MHFMIEKTDYKLSVSNGSVSAPTNTCKIDSVFLLPLDFAADSSHCS